MLIHDRKKSDWNPPVLKAVASKGEGVEEIIEAINQHNNTITGNKLKHFLLAEKAYKLIQNSRMKDIDKSDLASTIKNRLSESGFNVYQFVRNYSE